MLECKGWWECLILYLIRNQRIGWTYILTWWCMVIDQGIKFLHFIHWEPLMSLAVQTTSGVCEHQTKVSHHWQGRSKGQKDRSGVSQGKIKEAIHTRPTLNRDRRLWSPPLVPSAVTTWLMFYSYSGQELEGCCSEKLVSRPFEFRWDCYRYCSLIHFHDQITILILLPCLAFWRPCIIT